MDSLSVHQKIVLIKELGLDNDVQPYLNELEIDDALGLINKYKIEFNITPFIGKTNSHLLLEQAVKSNDVELVKKCLYCECKDNYFLRKAAFENGNSEIAILLLDKIKFQYDYSHIICKLNKNVVIKYFEMYKDTFKSKIYENICQYSNDETFLYFYNSLKDKVECFIPTISNGNLERVKMMIHLYGILTSNDIKYRRDLKSIENEYLSSACSTGDLELVKYLLSNRKTELDKDYDCISNVYSKDKNIKMDIIYYLHDLGFKTKIQHHHFNITNYTLEYFEWVLGNGIGSPLTYEVGDCGETFYDFYDFIKQKKIEYLIILQKYCNEKEWKKVMDYILSNWEKVGDDVFLPLIKNTKYLSSCRSISLIDYIMTLGDVTEQQWNDLFFELIPNINKENNLQIFKKYKDKLNLSLLISKIEKTYTFGNFWSEDVKNILINLLL